MGEYMYLKIRGKKYIICKLVFNLWNSIISIAVTTLWAISRHPFISKYPRLELFPEYKLHPVYATLAFQWWVRRVFVVFILLFVCFFFFVLWHIREKVKGTCTQWRNINVKQFYAATTRGHQFPAYLRHCQARLWALQSYYLPTVELSLSFHALDLWREWRAFHFSHLSFAFTVKMWKCRYNNRNLTLKYS